MRTYFNEKEGWRRFSAAWSERVIQTITNGGMSYSRAMLTFLLMVDLQSAFNDSTDPVLQTMAVNWTDIFEKSTYAGMSSLTLFVPFRFDDCTIAVAYVPILDTATYMIGDATTDFEIEYVLSKSCGGDYYENTSDALLEVMSDFQSDD